MDPSWDPGLLLFALNDIASQVKICKTHAIIKKLVFSNLSKLCWNYLVPNQCCGKCVILDSQGYLLLFNTTWITKCLVPFYSKANRWSLAWNEMDHGCSPVCKIQTTSFWLIHHQADRPLRWAEPKEDQLDVLTYRLSSIPIPIPRDAQKKGSEW